MAFTRSSIKVINMAGDIMVQLNAYTDENVSDLKQRVITELKLDPLTTVDLFRDGCRLPHAAKLADAGIEPGEVTMTGVLQEHFILDDSKKGKGVVLEGNNVVRNTTANGNACAPGSCRVILGKHPMPQGRHYFRVRLVRGDYYYIGVAEEGVNLNKWLGAQENGWSYYLRDDRMGSRLGPGYKNYGPGLDTGDTVTFRYDTVAGTVDIGRNNDELKPALTGLAGKDLFLALGMGPNDVTLKLESAWREQ